MKLWILVLIGILIWDFGFVCGAIWRGIFADMPIVKPIDGSLEADSAEYLSKAGM